MAANCGYDEPASPDKTIATVEIGGIQYQCMVLCDGTTGKSVVLPVDATYGIPVDVKRAVAVSDVNDKVTIAGTEYDVKSVAVNATASGDNSVISAVVGKRYRVLSINLWSDTALGVAIKDSAGTLIEAMTVAIGGSIQINPPHGYIAQCGATNRALILNLSGVGNVRGVIQYVELTA